jgi:glucose/arabinose dehydrogenase
LEGLLSRQPTRQTISFLALLCLALLVVAAAFNFRGWRAQVLSHVTRISNYPLVVEPPRDFLPKAPPGFVVSVFASGFRQPRWLAVAPNGDIFVADSAAGKIVVLHRSREQNLPVSEVFAESLNLPFGMAFHEGFVYIACTNEVLRFAFDPISSKATSGAEHVLGLPGLGYHQHWTRSLAFSQDGRTMFVSVGSETNVSVESDPRRAAVLAVDPDGNHMRIFASGLRNAVGIAVCPQTGSLWAAVNERDNNGDDVPSDFFTHIADGGFYGWPFSYSGSHVDNRVPARPDLVKKALLPDVFLGAHVAPLQFAFYEGQQFPPQYRQGVFIAEHGSWNRRIRSGYQVVFLPFRDGQSSGPPIPFLFGFVPNLSKREVYGRPVGVAMQQDGSLLVSDDGRGIIWRVQYKGQN